MKSTKSTIALICGLVLGLGPWILLPNPGIGWFLISMFGGLLVAMSGLGAEMKMLGKGDTSEDLFDEIWDWVKRKISWK